MKPVIPRMFDQHLSHWEGLCTHASIMGKLVTFENPLGTSMRGYISSVRFDRLARTAEFTLAAGRCEMRIQGSTVWVPAGDRAEVVTIELNEDCGDPVSTLEATTASIDGARTLLISHVQERATIAATA